MFYRSAGSLTALSVQSLIVGEWLNVLEIQVQRANMGGHRFHQLTTNITGRDEIHASS